MSNFIAYLQSKIAEAATKLEEATRERIEAEFKAAQAHKQIAAYQATLDFELSASGFGGAGPAIVGTIDAVGKISDSTFLAGMRDVHIAGVDDDGEDDEENTNATLVRKFFRDRGSKGVKPYELNRFFTETNMKVHKNYAYSILARLKKRREITVRNGRYYATTLLLDRIAPVPTEIEKEATVAAS